MIIDKKIILASASPRRSELLKNVNIEFSVVTKAVDETVLPNENATELVKRLSQNKAQAVANEVTDFDAVIGADTVVVLENEILGKPATKEAAKHMLQQISGKKHEVLTGVTIIFKKKMKTFVSKTEVEFHKLTDAEIDFYINNFEVLDKAGAYAIQDWLGAIGIASISGDYYNVVGLPVNKVYQVLQENL